MIVSCGVVTWIPRILPFVFSKQLVFPKRIKRYLDYLPLAILSALLFQNLLMVNPGHLPQVKGNEILACIPALMVGYYTRDLMKIVLAGVITVAFLRLVF